MLRVEIKLGKQVQHSSEFWVPCLIALDFLLTVLSKEQAQYEPWQGLREGSVVRDAPHTVMTWSAHWGQEAASEAELFGYPVCRFSESS